MLTLRLLCCERFSRPCARGLCLRATPLASVNVSSLGLVGGADVVVHIAHTWPKVSCLFELGIVGPSLGKHIYLMKQARSGQKRVSSRGISFREIDPLRKVAGVHFPFVVYISN